MQIEPTTTRARSRSLRPLALAAGLVLGATLSPLSLALAQDSVTTPLPAVPVPAENPITEAKRVLGKILFWDEQLSSDDSMSCGTCHIPSAGGADPRIMRHPGPDGVLGNSDDTFGSPGVLLQDSADAYTPSDAFGSEPQVTPRQAPSMVFAQFAEATFWDGRASGRFEDPQTGATVINTGGALESQAAGPPQSDVEMSHMARDWDAITAKLAASPPLGLASDLPADVATAIVNDPSYPALFARAFGTQAITARRIAFAIATYERTLVADQTPLDRFIAGDLFALTAAESRGRSSFETSGCASCHKGSVLSDGSFRNIGLRPISDDEGLSEVTGLTADRGKFKVPSLRNVSLRPRFMHTGQFASLQEVLRFYARAPGTQQFPENQDIVMRQLFIPPPVAADIEAFLRGALTDQRVADEEFPFDRPKLFSELTPANPALTGSGTTGEGGIAPVIIARVPPRLGSDVFKLGVVRARGGAEAFLAVSGTPPSGGLLTADETLGPVALGGSAAGEGFATLAYPLTDPTLTAGQDLYFQWRVTDPSADGGVAVSPVAKATLFQFEVEPPVDPDPDPEPDPDPLPVVDDTRLYVRRAAFVINHARHAAGRPSDTFLLVGNINPALLSRADVQLRLTLDVGDTQIIHTAALSARGRIRAVTDDLMYKVSLDARTGNLVCRISRADLRSTLGLADETASSSTALPIQVAVEGVGSTAPPAVASTLATFVYSGRAGRATRGKHSMTVAPPPDGVFTVSSVRATPRADGYSLALGAVAAAPGDIALDPVGDIVIVVGDADPVSAPFSALQRTTRGFGYRVAGSPLGAITRLRFVHATGKLQLAISSLAGTGLDAVLVNETVLPVVVRIPTVDGLAEFRTDVLLRRASTRSLRWRR